MTLVLTSAKCAPVELGAPADCQRGSAVRSLLWLSLDAFDPCALYVAVTSWVTGEQDDLA